MRIAARLLPGLLALWLAPVAGHAACADMTFDGEGYTVCEVGAAEDLRVFHAGPDGRPYGSFAAVNAALARGGQALGVAMNGGMYHRDRAPVGLLVDDGAERSPIVTADGPGNFGLLPNGVFCVGDGYRVIESRTFADRPPACRFATQSGPMLVIGGDLHPRFLAGSTSRYIRNGIGVSADGTRAVMAISARPVTFHAFARLFRDGLGLPDALYLDGSISRLYAPAIGRNDVGLPMGPILGTVVPAG